MENVNWGPSIFLCDNVDAVNAYLRENFPSDAYPPRDITCLCQQ
jgi:hypothetical protein